MAAKMTNAADGRQYIHAEFDLLGMTPLSTSRMHGLEPLQGESHDAFDRRIWREKMHTLDVAGRPHLAIPVMAVRECITAGAKSTGQRVPGGGMKTWASVIKPALAGYAALLPSDVPVDAMIPITINAHAQGKRGVGARVQRTFPITPTETWILRCAFMVLDLRLTEDVLLAMLKHAGLMVGIGRYRPENGGENGRFRPALRTFERRAIEQLLDAA